jgi:hypothetical protein
VIGLVRSFCGNGSSRPARHRENWAGLTRLELRLAKAVMLGSRFLFLRAWLELTASCRAVADGGNCDRARATLQGDSAQENRDRPRALPLSSSRGSNHRLIVVGLVHFLLGQRPVAS